MLLINSTAFKARYEADLPKAVAGAHAMMPLRSAIDEATAQVILGQWQTTGGVAAPGGLIERTTTWVTRALGTDPDNGRARVPSMAQFDVHTRPVELLRRARLYVERPGESFEEFCKVSLRDFVRGVGRLGIRAGRAAAATSRPSSPRRCRWRARWPVSTTKRCNEFIPASRPNTATSSPRSPSPASRSTRRCSRCCAPIRASTRRPRTTTRVRCPTRTA